MKLLTHSIASTSRRPYCDGPTPTQHDVVYCTALQGHSQTRGCGQLTLDLHVQESAVTQFEL